MTPQHIAKLRTKSQLITERSFSNPHDVVKWFGAVQAQDYPAAKWAVAQRTQGFLSDQDMEQAINDKQIIRTWPMRGTLHFVPPEDAHWMLDLMASRVIASFAGRYRQLGLEEADFQKSRKVLAAAMQGGKPMIRKELMQALMDSGFDTSDQKGYHMLVYAAHQGDIALTSLQGKQPTFVWFDDWLPENQRITMAREEALAEIARRYIQSHGPVTVRDFSWWSGLTLTDCRTAIGSIHNELTRIDNDEEAYWIMGDIATNVPESVFLAPSFDEIVVALKDRTAVVSVEDLKKVVPYTNGIFSPVVVVNGQFVGLWVRTIKNKGVEIAFELSHKLTAAQQKLVQQEAVRYAAFLDLPLLKTTFTDR